MNRVFEPMRLVKKNPFQVRTYTTVEPPAPETPIPGVVVDGTEYMNDASDPYYRGQSSCGSPSFSPPEENTGEVEGKPAKTSEGTCQCHHVIPTPLTPRPAGGFGSLKDVLRAILAAYIDHEVCLHLPARYSPLTNPTAGNRCRQKQDRKPPFMYCCTGSSFCNTSR